MPLREKLLQDPPPGQGERTLEGLRFDGRLASHYAGRVTPCSEESHIGLLRSSLASLVALALTQAGHAGLGLRDLARACRTRDSSVQRALGVLLDEGIATKRGGESGGRYFLAGHPLEREVLTLAFHDMPRAAALATLCLANAAVEFAGLDAQGLFVVFRQRATAETRLLLGHALEGLGAPVALTSFLHDTLTERLRQHPELRARAARSVILAGTLSRSFPDRRRHGDLRRARPLGRPHPSLRLPSQRALRRIAERFRLEELDLFGSAVRSDFRPDSDLDVLVRPRPDARLRIADLVGLEDALEQLFDRDVDLVTPETLDGRFRSRVEREVVALYG